VTEAVTDNLVAFRDAVLEGCRCPCHHGATLVHPVPCCRVCPRCGIAIPLGLTTHTCRIPHAGPTRHRRAGGPMTARADHDPLRLGIGGAAQQRVEELTSLEV
jgi:hypothetical protein